MKTIMALLFGVIVVIAYYFDYKHNKENYKEKGESKLYLIVIGIIILTLLKLIFF